ncbi:hypothetical protein [Tangfeifania diversioriginum]|nr:hypothetical protein [Tangfeifania diversioriginum]
MKTERNLFQEWLESQSLFTNCCKVTETGKVLWNEGEIIIDLEKLGHRSVLIDKKIRFLRFQENEIKETNYSEIKDLILERMNCTGSQKERMHLIRNNLFFAEDLLKNLKEAIPERAVDNSLEFYNDEGIFTVTKDGTFIDYWA